MEVVFVGGRTSSSSSDATKRLSSLSPARLLIEAFDILGVKAGGVLAAAGLVKKLEIDCCFLAELCEEFCVDTIVSTT